jgi:protein phosphatase
MAFALIRAEGRFTRRPGPEEETHMAATAPPHPLDPTDTLPPAPPPPSTSATGLRARAHGVTDPGRVRDANEDQFLIAELSRTLVVRQASLAQPPQQQARARALMLVVADGMGGHAAGEVASALSIEAVEDFVLELLRRFSHLQPGEEHGVIDDLREAVEQADIRVLEEARRRPELAGMGATLVVGFASGNRLFVIHAGDCRAYLFRNGALMQLTEDHTLVAGMVERGEITPEQARDHPRRHLVTSAVGGGRPGVHVDVQRVFVEPGDVVLFCSDGLSDMLDDARIARALAEVPEPEAACRRLVAEANEAGGKDNVTAVVARFEPA